MPRNNLLQLEAQWHLDIIISRLMVVFGLHAEVICFQAASRVLSCVLDSQYQDRLIDEFAAYDRDCSLHPITNITSLPIVPCSIAAVRASSMTCLLPLPDCKGPAG
jgi:hypothetical protein